MSSSTLAHPILRRVLVAVTTAAGISILSFLGIMSRSGEALAVVAEARRIGDGPGRADLARELGVDRALPERLGLWLADLARGDLGQSWSQPGRTVGDVLGAALPATLGLTGGGLILMLALGVGAAALSVRWRGTWRDAALSAASATVYAMPEFCLGILLLWPFAVKLGWFPLSGASPGAWTLVPGQEPGMLDRLHHFVLPGLCLALGGSAVVARLLRVRWQEEADSRYVVAARARGLTGRRVLWVHSLRNASGPLCAAVGLALPGMVGGAIVVERVFDWPGLGSALLAAASARDLPVLAGANVVLAALVTAGGLVSDLLVVVLDPRVRIQ